MQRWGQVWAARLVLAVAAGSASAQAANVSEMEELVLPPGFHAELVYSPTGQQQGSWVAMTIDSRGRIIASDENGRLYRVTPSPLGTPPSETQVEPLDIPLGMAQGLLCVDDVLYVMVNTRRPQEAESGLYRVTDADGDDRFDRVEMLRVLRGAGEHGPHGVALGPDGKSLYFCSGNATRPPLYSRTLVPPVWQEDQLLPRLPDPRGHANDVEPPGGWIARCDLDGENLELFCVGFRNTYDIAFNDDGELFTFDADMEWDLGMPWYRPTRICHATSGVDFGWRSGNGKWRDWYIDSLPAAVDVGPGSPTGLTFGGQAEFPGRYQQALFAGDWSYGRIYAIHLQPAGASYRGEVEIFASAMPLAVTDLQARPQDGALYFVVGGRNTASALYRIFFEGEAGQPDSSDKSDPETTTLDKQQVAAAEAARQQRRQLETFHGLVVDGAVDQLWPYLASDDRVLQSAARIALEHQPLDRWRERALSDDDPRTKITALAAAARLGEPRHLAQQARALIEASWDELPRRDQLDLLRAMGLTSLRLGPLPDPLRNEWIEFLASQFPTGTYKIDSELARLLVHLDAVEMAEVLVERLEQSDSHEQGLDFAVAASALRGGWTTDLRERMLRWFLAAARHGGGASSFGYLASARQRMIAMMPSNARKALGELATQPLTPEPVELATASRTFVKSWKVDEVVKLLSASDRQPDYQRGREMFAAASCYQCHRIGGAGSTVGPDLTGAGRRFSVEDLATAMVEPNKHISDQYQQQVFQSGGRTYVGRITNLWDDEVAINTDVLDPKSHVVLRVDAIDDQFPSDISMMPSGLLDTLHQDEVVDLFAYIRSGGDPNHRIYE